MEIIRETSKGFVLYSKKGRRLGGPYKTRKEAEEREAQVNYFKHKGGK